ncbi:MAG: hypothetical protein HY360_06270 [Verrucomicrobia bacterium]|nr:hypothetical protein [Verrucomicrobiota bacterium]
MIRTQICLNLEDAHWLKSQARARGVSMAQVTRELIRAAIHPAPSATRPDQLKNGSSSKLKARFPFVGCLRGGARTDVTRVDDYLYGVEAP